MLNMWRETTKQEHIKDMLDITIKECKLIILMHVPTASNILKLPTEWMTE